MAVRSFRLHDLEPEAGYRASPLFEVDTADAVGKGAVPMDHGVKTAFPSYVVVVQDLPNWIFLCCHGGRDSGRIFREAKALEKQISPHAEGRGIFP